MQPSVKNILIYRLGSLGDTVIALPCFHKIRQAYPDANIILLTNKPVASKAAPVEAVLGHGFFFSQVVYYPLGTRNPYVLFNIWKTLYKLRVDTIINIAAARTVLSNKRDILFFKICGIKKFIGFPKEKRDFELEVEKQTGDREWEAARLVRRIAELGHTDLADERNWDLQLLEAELTAARDIIDSLAPNRPIIAVSAGTKMQSKDWGAENWRQLMRLVKANLPSFNLILIGSTDEFSVSEACLAEWGGDGLNLAGKISPRVSAAVLKHCRLFIGHDSGPMHLAAGVGIPVVAVFSAQNLPRQWYPRGNANRVIYHKTDCAGCGLETCIEQKKKCILSISVQEVLEAVLASINEKQPRHG